MPRHLEEGLVESDTLRYTAGNRTGNVATAPCTKVVDHRRGEKVRQGGVRGRLRGEERPEVAQGRRGQGRQRQAYVVASTPSAFDGRGHTLVKPPGQRFVRRGRGECEVRDLVAKDSLE